MKKLVNANLKSKEEFLKRMIDGERFVLGKLEYFFTARRGFRAEHLGKNSFEHAIEAVVLMNIQLDKAKVWEDTPWHENIPGEGVLCWVSDLDATDKTFSAVIFSYCSGQKLFRTRSGTKWKYATPVKPEECFQENSND